MKELTELLIKLATELGTTTEHLWAALLQQAFISATTDVLYLVCYVAALVSILMIIRKENSRKDDEKKWDKDGETVFILGIIEFILIILAIAIVPKLIGGVATGFFNPEYWALMEVMR